MTLIDHLIWSLTVNGERCRHSVIPADEGIFCRVVCAGVHDLQLVEFSLNHDSELLTHLDLHAVFQPRGWHVEVRNFTLKHGHLCFWDCHALHGFGDSQSCNRQIQKQWESVEMRRNWRKWREKNDKLKLKHDITNVQHWSIFFILH